MYLKLVVPRFLSFTYGDRASSTAASYLWNKLPLIKRRCDSLNQSSVAERLRLWVNLGVISPLSDWEVVGSNPTAGMSRIGFLSREEISIVFPSRKRFVFHSPPNKCTLWPICSPVLLL